MRWPHLALLLGAFAALVIALTLAARPPAVRPDSAPAQEFSAVRALEDVRGLTSTGRSHHVESRVDHDRAREYVLARLRALGLSPEVQESSACARENVCAPVQNVMARIGEPRPDALMLAAHYDSARGAPGAADDGAGVATVLEIVRALRAGPPPTRPVIVLFTDGEELGLLGARAFVKEHPWAKQVAVVLNFEARGTSGQTAMFETSAGSAWLVKEYARAVRRPVASSVIYTLYKALPNDTDLTVFKAAGMQGLNFAFADEVWNYHTPNDDLQHLDPRSLQHMGDQGLAVTRALLARETISPKGADGVWFEIFTLELVVYPTWGAVAFELLALALATLAIIRALRTKQVDARALALAVLWLLLSVVLAMLSGAIVCFLVERLARRERPWFFHPLPTWIALVAGAIAIVSATSAWRLRDRMSDSAALAGALLVWGLLSAVLARLAPGTSHLFTWPVIAGSCALLWMASASAPWARATALTGGAFVTAFLWFPLMRVLLVMVGADVHFVTTIPVALVLSFVEPMQRALLGRVRWAVPVGAAVTCLFAVLYAGTR